MFPNIYTDIYRKPTDYYPPTGAELVGNLNYPHLNSTEYRQAPIDRTIRINRVWEGIALNNEKHAVIGTNKVTGREWCSTLWGFEKPLEKIDEKMSCFKLQIPALLTQIEYVSNNMLIATFRNGSIQLWSTHTEVRDEKNPYCLFSIAKEYCNDTINCLELMEPQTKKAITGGQDGNLRVWHWAESELKCSKSYSHVRYSESELKCIKSFEYAHLNAITGISHQKSNDNILATCGLDYSVMFWDLRKDRPAHALYEEHDYFIKAIVWNDSNFTNSNHLFIGDTCGYIHKIDSRKSKKFVSSVKLCDRAVRKIVCNGDNLAVIADNNIVKIYSITEDKLIYENDSHRHIVRDCVWYDDSTLLTVGLDTKLRKHNIKKIKN